uniref:Retrovirus-related Pol polyprotein from transposon TNT 1-94 n=1 Tax=Tanacetum cinerariifolium TaxID=118510 RepID=A0A6L2NTP0_TANCI|nr:retrovirus-related Pol polyprotein from transposon TNT 1-94 [Tanacetum cinerariifolium]
MSTQQDIYAADFENRPPMLNKENYVPWSSRLLRYAKSRPNGKLIYISIINGPYVRRMIPEPGDANREVPVNETFHEQTDDELTEKELKQVEADDQAIQTILLGLPEDIYAVVDSCKTAQEIWLLVQQMMKADLDEIEKVNANCILMANLQQASTLGTQTDKAPVYNSDGLAETCMYATLFETGGDGALPKRGKTRRMGEVVETRGEKGRVVATVVVGLKEVAVRGGEWHRGSYRSGRGEHFWGSREKSPETAASGGDGGQRANVSNTENQKKQNLKVMKPKKVGSNERLASPKPSKPRSYLRWSPTGRLFDLKGKIIASSEYESQSDCSNGNRTTKLYTINLYDMASASPICLMARATSTKSWLWHQRLSHLNFDTINDLAKNDLVTGLPKFKYHIEHLCPSCEQRKRKRASHPPKPVPNSKQRLHLLHMDLCGPMRIASINGKRYVLVIVDDYSSYTWVHFLISKDEAPKVIKTFLKRITVLLQSLVIIIRTDNGTEFKNQILKEYFDSVGISHQASSVRTPQQNGVVERRNRTLVEAAITMLIFSCVPLFLWAEVIATACYTQNSSIIHLRFNKTPYELINGRKLDISFIHVFGALCFSKNDREDIGSLMKKDKENHGDNDVTFDELLAMAFEQSSSKPGLQSMTSGQISSGLDLTYAPSTITTQQPTEGKLDLPFEAMYDDYIGGQPSATPRTTLAAQNVKKAMIGPARIESMQEELLQFKWLDVWVLVPALDNITPLALKWLFKNKHDEENTVIRNKTRLVVRGYRQEEGIDFEESFALNHFFKGTIDPMLFIRRFDDDILVVHVYVDDIIFGSTHPRMETCDPIGTPMEIKDKLDLDQNRTLVDAKKYHSMIGSLMYLTSSRPDIVHATCLCARYQAKPTEKHLKEVKRIFRYLRGTVNTGLWYTKDSGFEVTGFSDVDYAGYKDSFKSTSGGTQFLGEKLVRWSSKKQDCIALSTAEAEYVSLSAVGISHQVSSVRTPQQNRVVKRRNQTLIEATRTMLIFSRAPLFLWAEAIATACFTQNRSIIHRRFNKTPYELINDRKPDISFLHVFGALCYPKNDREDIRKLGAKGDIGFVIGYSADSCAFRVYKQRTKKIIETMNVSFDELSAMAFEQRSSKPELQRMTSGQISLGLDLTYAPSTITTQQPTEGELDLLFEAMYDDYIGGQPSTAPRTVLAAQAHQVHQTPTTSTSIADTTPTPTNSSSQATNFPNSSHDVDEINSQQKHAQQ